jgi:hypothetical protein
MKSFLISLFVVVPAVLFAQKKENKEYKGGGAITFANTTHVFGKVKEEKGPVETKFEFVNSGKGPLRIKNVLTSCGCTTPDWSKDVINPGERGFVKATFDPHNRPGNFSRTLTVLTNGSPDAVTLTVEGTVISEKSQMLAMFPDAIGNLRVTAKQVVIPAIAEDKTDTIWLGVYNTSRKNIIIRTVVTPFHMRTEAKNVLLLPDQGDNIMMTYNAAMIKDLGQHISKITLVTDDDSVVNKEVTIKANIVQNFGKLTAEQKANPPVASVEKWEANVGELYVGESASFTFQVANKGKSDLVIRKIYSACDCISAKAETTVIKKGKKGNVTVQLNTKGLHGNIDKTVNLIVNDPMLSIVTLHMKAKVVIPGQEPISN